MEYECYVCRRPASDLHHIFCGRNRKTSDKLGMVVHLCREHHNEVHAHPNHGLDEILKKEAQEAFETTHTREEFIKLFGKSYL